MPSEFQMEPSVVRDFEPSISARVSTAPVPRTSAELYLDLLKRTLTRTVVARPHERHTMRPRGAARRLAHSMARALLNPLEVELVRLRPTTCADYEESGHAAMNRVEDAETMIGTRQLDNLQECITHVIRDGVAGDLLEAGVWRGGVTIMMRAVLKAFEVTDRTVWVADSFAGLPPPDKAQDSYGWRGGDMAVPLEVVRDNFARYGLLDGQVRFLEGFFSDTLPHAPIERLSILRVDADLYESTRDVLDALYPKLQPGGFAIFDDYRNLADCRRAIDEYRGRHGIDDPIEIIDQRAVFWRKGTR